MRAMPCWPAKVSAWRKTTSSRSSTWNRIPAVTPPAPRNSSTAATNVPGTEDSLRASSIVVMFGIFLPGQWWRGPPECIVIGNRQLKLGSRTQLARHVGLLRRADPWRENEQLNRALETVRKSGSTVNRNLETNSVRLKVQFPDCRQSGQNRRIVCNVFTRAIMARSDGPYPWHETWPL